MRRTQLSDTVKVNGMVLSAAAAKETDRHLMILTKELGKISVFANGASRPQSTLRAAARPFVTGEFELLPRKDSYSLVSVSVREYFDSLLQDYDGLSYGCYFLEAAGYFSRENTDETAMLNLLFLSLKALEKGKMQKQLVRLVFDFRCFQISGEYPQVFECCECRAPLKEGYFVISRQGGLCLSCGEKSGGIRMNETVTYTLRYILTAPLTKLFGFSVSDETRENLEEILKLWKERFMDRKFKSEALLCENRHDTPRLSASEQ